MVGVTLNWLKASMENLTMYVAELSAQLFRLREEVFNTTSIRHEETATNEETIKDVQDAQSNLTQAIQILKDFYVKNFSASTTCFGGPRFTTEIRWDVPISLTPYK